MHSDPPTGRLPIDGFADGLFSVNMKDENGKMQKFYLFDKPEEGRTIRALFTQGLQHTHHLVEPARQLRHEQPAERFQVLVEAEAKQRQLPAMDASGGPGKKQSKKLISLNEMKLKVDAVIASREHNEKMAEANTAVAEEQVMPADMTGALLKVETIESVYGGSVGPAAPKKKPGKRAPAGAGSGTAAAKRKTRRTPDVQPVVTTPPVPPVATSGFDEPEGATLMDKLADAIKEKLGVESKGVRNLSLENILDGHALGRTIAGVACTYLKRFSVPFSPVLFFPDHVWVGLTAVLTVTSDKYT